METLLRSLFETGLLVIALSVDSFVASFSYGANHIRMPFRSVACISGICSGSLGLSLLVGRGLRSYLPEGARLGFAFCCWPGWVLSRFLSSLPQALIPAAPGPA